MRPQVLSIGTSIGLSALLAGLLLATAKPEDPAEPMDSTEMQIEVTEPILANKTKSRHYPSTIVLPSPPPPPLKNYVEEITKLTHVIMLPLAATKIERALKIMPLQPNVKESTPAVSLKPLLPSRNEPNQNTRIPKNKITPTPTFKNTLPNSDSEKSLVLVRPNEDAELITKGRVLLRMLEHGRGPTVELAWPERARDQEKLYQLFKNCMGMRLALQDGEGRLYIVNSRPGHTWLVNFDHFSGFARQPTGRLAETELRDISNIAKHHGLSYRANAIRIFPRYVDAQLLGGLRRLVGTGYNQADNVRAKYGVFANNIVVMDILVDGREVVGRVMLASPAKSSCRIG